MNNKSEPRDQNQWSKFVFIFMRMRELAARF